MMRSVELRLSRWRGWLPTVTLELQDDVLSRRAMFAGRPVPPTSPTAEGERGRVYVLLERLVAGTWRRIGGVARADGTFRRFLKAGERGTRVRAILPGPNVGTTLAPGVVRAAVSTER